MFGKIACTPQRKHKETCEQCFHRVCIDDAPAPWIAERSIYIRDKLLKQHGRHSTEPFPQLDACRQCTGGKSIASWKKITEAMYNGDPFSLKCDKIGLKYIEPEFLREGAGTWGGKPSW